MKLWPFILIDICVTVAALGLMACAVILGSQIVAGLVLRAVQ